MLLLATDTSGKYGSIALARCQEEEGCEVIEVVPLAGGTFSAQLVPQIATLLAKHSSRKEDLGGFAVATGPGSFTGLRVGLAAIKALVEVLGKPLAAVSLLEAVSARSSGLGPVLALMDAGRGEVFAGRYEILSKSTLRLLSEDLFLIADVRHLGNVQHVITPDASLAEVLRDQGIAVQTIERPRSDAIARLGWRKLQAGDTVSPEELEASYIRRSDAEILSNRK